MPDVHVLFLHGVGKHFRLSSFLEPYQALRERLDSPELPHPIEDVISNWTLERFDDGAASAFLKLSNPTAVDPNPRNVYFYEVNYSDLAEVVRKNHPIDLTRLFVGFDLTVHLARHRMDVFPPVTPSEPEAWRPDHMAIADHVRGLSEVLVALTVPVLGIFPYVFTRVLAVRGFLSAFTRFFEDVATFAMDRSGLDLVSEHVEETVGGIVRDQRYGEDDHLIIVGHSLGSVVAHRYLVRHWFEPGREVPRKVLTSGAPIGLLCWLWLFLDFHRMNPASGGHPDAEGFFAWNWEKPPPDGTPCTVQWMNVVNYMDPIATSFPQDYSFLGLPSKGRRVALEGGAVDHRFIRTGGILPALFAHTAHVLHRPANPEATGGGPDTFLDLLASFVGLEGRGIPARDPEVGLRHWRAAIRHLGRLRILCWALGISCLALAVALVEPGLLLPNVLLLWVPFYVSPTLVIGYLAFTQRWVWGGATKRINRRDISETPLFDHRVFVARARVIWTSGATLRARLREELRMSLGMVARFMTMIPYRFGNGRLTVADALPNDQGRPVDPIVEWMVTLARQVAVVVAVFVILVGHLVIVVRGKFGAWPRLVIPGHLGWVAGLSLAYLMLFALSAFAARWRRLVIEVTSAPSGQNQKQTEVTES